MVKIAYKFLTFGEGGGYTKCNKRLFYGVLGKIYYLDEQVFKI